MDKNGNKIYYLTVDRTDIPKDNKNFLMKFKIRQSDSVEKDVMEDYTGMLTYCLEHEDSKITYPFLLDKDNDNEKKWSNVSIDKLTNHINNSKFTVVCEEKKELSNKHKKQLQDVGVIFLPKIRKEKFLRDKGII